VQDDAGAGFSITYKVVASSAFGRGKEEVIMKTKLLLTVVLAASSLFAGTHFSFGVGIGTPVYYVDIGIEAYESRSGNTR